MNSPNETVIHLKYNSQDESPSFDLPLHVNDSNLKNIDVDFESCEKESHLTPASLSPTTYRLLSANMHKSKPHSSNNTPKMRFAMFSSIDSYSPTSKQIPKVNIQEKSESGENIEDSDNNSKNHQIYSNQFNKDRKTKDNANSSKTGFKTSQSISLEERTSSGNLASNPKIEEFILKSNLEQAGTRKPNLFSSIGTSPAHKTRRRLGVCMLKGLTSEQLYFLENGFGNSNLQTERTNNQKTDLHSKKFVNIIASAANNSNSPAAKTLLSALKKINPNALEDFKKKKKNSQPILQRFFHFLKQICENVLCYVFEPDTSVIIFMHVLTVLMTLIDVFYIPFLLSFYYPELSKSVMWLEYQLFGFFFSTLVLKFNIGYYSKGTIVKDRRKIAKHYLKKTFLLDFFIVSISIPRVLFECNTLIYFESIRILRIIYLRRGMSNLEDYFRLSVVPSGMVRLAKLWVSILIVAHFLACIFHIIGTEDKEQTSWLDKFDFRDQTIFKRYVASAYWAVTTMITIGYGDITPKNEKERIFGILAMLFASGVFGYSMNTINQIMEEIDEFQSVKKKKIRRANNYMKMKGLDKDLQLRVRKYLEHNLDEKNYKRNLENNFVEMLQGKLKQEVLIEINGKVLRDSLIFQENNFTKKFLANISQSLMEIFFSPEQEIFFEGDSLDQSMYFLTRGKVQIYLKSCTKIIKNLKKSSYFGEISFFTGKPRSASAKSLNFSEVFCLKKERFMEILQYNPLDKEQFNFLKDMVNLELRYDLLKMRCYGCDEVGHIILDCPQLKLIVNKKGVIQQYLRDCEKSRRIFKRKRNKVLFSKVKILEGIVKIQKNLERQIIFPESYDLNYSEYTIVDGQNSPTIKYPRKRKRLATLDEQMMLDKTQVATYHQINPLTFKKINLIDRKNRSKWFDSYLMEINFDRVANYELYFPHNNIQKLIFEFENKRIDAIIGLGNKSETNNMSGNKIFKKSIKVIGRLKNIPMINTKPNKFKYKSIDDSPGSSDGFQGLNSLYPPLIMNNKKLYPKTPLFDSYDTRSTKLFDKKWDSEQQKNEGNNSKMKMIVGLKSAETVSKIDLTDEKDTNIMKIQIISLVNTFGAKNILRVISELGDKK